MDRGADGAVTLILGVGSPVAGDEAGMVAVERLRTAGLSLAGPVVWRVLERPGVSLLEAWRGAAQVVLIDALQTDTPGEPVRRIEPALLQAEAGALSVHSAGVAEALALAEVLGELPSRLWIYGIDSRYSGETERWLEPLARMLEEDLAADR
ncbi:MAG: hydrogenase maturation protease [Pseudomonadota bacterium]